MTLYNKFRYDSILVLSIILFLLSGRSWALTIDSIYPTLEELGNNLEVTIRGTDFNADTKISFYPDRGNRSSLIGQIDLPGKGALNFEIRGNIAYVVNGDAGLVLLDIIDPTKPVIIDTFNPELSPGAVTCRVSALFVQGNIAYITTFEQNDSDETIYRSLKLIDIDRSSPAYLTEIGSTELADNASCLFVQDNIAYIGVINNLYLINVNPVSPEYLTIIDTAVISSIAYGFMPITMKIINNRAYIANFGNSDRLLVIDVDPSSSSYLTQIDSLSAGHARDLTIAGNMLYLASDYGLEVVDIDPISPSYLTIIETIKTSDNVSGVWVEDNTAYVTDYSSNVYVIDLNPSSPTFRKVITSIIIEYAANRVVVSNNICFVIGTGAYVNNALFQLVNIDTVSKETTIGSYENINGLLNEVIVSNDIAYVIRPDISFELVDVNSTSPTFLSPVERINTSASYFDIANNKAYLVQGLYCMLSIIDLDAQSPTYLQVTATSDEITGFYDSCEAIQVVDNTAYLAINSSTMLLLVDVDPTSPTFLTDTGSVVPVVDGVANDLDVVNNKAYIADYTNGLHIFDVDPESPAFLTKIASVVTGGNPRSVTVVNNIAYVNDKVGLKLIDVNSASPNYLDIIGSVETESDVGFGQKIINKLAYISVSGGIDVIDIDQASSTYLSILASIGMAQGARHIEVNDNVVYVTSGWVTGYLTLIPDPKILTEVNVISNSEISATLPSPPVSGNYTLRILNGVDNETVLGAVTFADEINLLTSKAIIVAGGGPQASGNIWEETKAYANYAYDNLIYQGYRHEDIYYLTDEEDALARYGYLASFANLVTATKDNLQEAMEAITQLARSDTGISGLLLYLVDHGASEEFQIRGGVDQQTVTVRELDSWLNTLQTTMKGKVVFIYDACKSGSFIDRNSPASTARISLFSELNNSESGSSPVLSMPEADQPFWSNTQSNGTGNNAFLPAITLLLKSHNGFQDKDRIVITSSSSNEVSYFLNPSHSFSYHFWSTLSGKAGNKANLSDAFKEASSIMSFYQTPQLDANGNGIPNEDKEDDYLKDLGGEIYALRRQYSSDLTKPVIGIVSGTQTLSGTNVSTTFMASDVYDIDGDTIVRVWAEIIRPDYNPHQGSLTVTNLPTVELTYDDSDDVYEGLSSDDDVYFDVEGVYIVNFFAKDDRGIYSQPKTSLVIKK